MSHFAKEKLNFEWCYRFSTAFLSHNYMTKYKFVYIQRAILRTALGAAPRERPTANSIRIAAAVQKHSIRNKPALLACLLTCSRTQLVAFQFPCITRMESEINCTFYYRGLFPCGRYLRLSLQNFPGYAGCPIQLLMHFPRKRILQ